MEHLYIMLDEVEVEQLQLLVLDELADDELVLLEVILQRQVELQIQDDEVEVQEIQQMFDEKHPEPEVLV